jgi:hypothetical protein
MHRERKQSTASMRLTFSAALVLMGAIAAGCASRVVDVTDDPAGRRLAADQAPRDGAQSQSYGRGQSSYENGDQPRDPSADRYSSGSDPRAVRTADGRPAPYGRDPETGRAINDAQPLPQPSTPRYAPPYRPLPPPAAVGARPVAPPAAALGSSIVVAKGDTLHSLARRYKVKVDDIKRANALTNDQIKIGQKLAILGA